MMKFVLCNSKLTLVPVDASMLFTKHTFQGNALGASLMEVWHSAFLYNQETTDGLFALQQ